MRVFLMAGYEEFYRLTSLDELLGNESAVEKLMGFASDIDDCKARKPLLIYGPSGTGKTAAVHLLADKHHWNIVEMGANDYRDEASVERRLIAAATSRSIFGKRNVIILDEIDELAAGFDKGAGSAIGTLMKESRNPIIFIANDMWDRSITFLRTKTDPVQFRRLPAETIAKLLQRACRRMELHVDNKQIELISQRSSGDARSALNDLFAIAGSVEDVTEVLGLRDKKMDVFELLDKIFFSSSASAPLRAIMNTDLSNDMLINWLDENIPRRYPKASEMRKAYDSLSLATVFSTRAVRAQYYAYWRYMNAFMSSGVGLAKEEYPDRRYGYVFPQRIKTLSGTKENRKQNAAIAKKLQGRFHASIADIVRGELEMIAAQAAHEISCGHAKQEDIIESLMSDYGLDEQEAKGVVQLHA
jgi:replication factor C large subunit